MSYDDGITLVVSPLVSLISDQCYQMNKLVPECAAALLGTNSQAENNLILKNMLLGSKKALFKMVYVTPEKLINSKRLMSNLDKLYEKNRLKVDTN